MEIDILLKKVRFMTVRSMILLGAGVLGGAASAAASPIAAGSQIALTGHVSAIGSVSVNAATGLDFVSGPFGVSSVGAAGTIATDVAGSGTFFGLGCASGSCGTMQDLTNLQVGAAPISNFFSLGGGGDSDAIRFNLGSIILVDRSQVGSLTIVAIGSVLGGSFDPTAAYLTLSAQGNQVAVSLRVPTSIEAVSIVGSSSSPGTVAVGAEYPVPEPNSLMSLIVGMAALVGLRRNNEAEPKGSA